MDDHTREQVEWRATIIAAVVLVVVLGAEQFAPISDALRMQIGVLTVLLVFGFWHLICGLIQPGETKR